MDENAFLCIFVGLFYTEILYAVRFSIFGVMIQCQEKIKANNNLKNVNKALNDLL